MAHHEKSGESEAEGEHRGKGEGRHTSRDLNADIGWIERGMGHLMDNVSLTVKHFTAFIFIVFFFGVLIGEHASALGNSDLAIAAYAAPIVLAVLSYFFLDVAVVFFILFAILVFFI